MSVARRPNAPRSIRTRLGARCAIAAGRLLALLPPRQIRRILLCLRWRVRPATYAEAERSREDILAGSMGMRALRACLPRSLAIVLLCRFRGAWPTWCAGVRRAAPFSAHAWTEADGCSVGELNVAEAFVPLVKVEPKP
ncbi:lasso peptide biosynthesis B2 protein [Amycolatopsis halotolerans]